ncbi:MAG: radical SAM protein [Tissierellaceae bacterium]|jgi:histone acetyltransferase (RNA polymerase elongator complex component)|nr:radical SAM protein [Tissierellia bacterium]
MSKRYIIPIFVPHYGCPHACIFCNQKKITNMTTTTRPQDVEEIIERNLGYFWKDLPVELAFYGGSFTAIDMDIQSQLLEVPYRYKEKGIIHEIRLSTRPDAIDDRILTNLKSYGVDTIELGVQSLDEEVLALSDRGHSREDVYDAVKLIREFGFNLGLQMMVGLPGDDKDKSISTAREFINMQADLVRIYPTLVIKDTHLNYLYENNLYKPLSLEEAVDICTILLILFNLENIKVIRLGLQPTDNIQLGRDVVAGPFHPAFRQLVESNIYKMAIEDCLETVDYNLHGKTLTIESRASEISSISGQKSSNIKYLKEKFGLSRIKLFPQELDKDKIKIQLEDIMEILDLNLWMASYIKDCMNK